ncbi:MAG: V-type ATP synthase subunit I, partial [Treponema sp.]|nr:V-type ATP synthase subunit I [Treponema sp.]
MKKVALVIQDKAQDAALSKLREIGVLHLERRSVASEALAKALEQKNRGDNAMSLIRPFKASKKEPAAPASGEPAAGRRQGRRDSDAANAETEPYSLDAVNAFGRPDLIDLLLSLGKEKKILEDRLAFLGRERKRIQNWGNFDPRAVKDLAASGIVLYLYELSPNTFKDIPEETRYTIMGQDKIAVYLLVLDKEIPGLSPFSLPEKSLGEIDAETAELPAKIEAIDKKFASFADRMPVLQNDMADIQRNIEFESARAALEVVEDVPSEYALSWITGFVPQEDVGFLKRAAVENNWALLADDPGLDDQVPTKLKNNALASLIYPLTGFLEVTPGYNEVDISPWFLFFFVIFFGMIFGDA